MARINGTWHGPNGVTQDISIPDTLCKRPFNQNEIDQLLAGKEIFIQGFTSKKGNPFDSWVVIAPRTDDNGEESLDVQFDFNRISPIFHGHTFTDEEMAALDRGESLIVRDLISKKGSRYAAWVTPDNQGGLKMDFDKFIPPEAGSAFLGHTFTQAEAEALNAGEAIEVDDLYSKRKNKEFKATLHIGDNHGKKGIIMEFDD